MLLDLPLALWTESCDRISVTAYQKIYSTSWRTSESDINKPDSEVSKKNYIHDDGNYGWYHHDLKGSKVPKDLKKYVNEIYTKISLLCKGDGKKSTLSSHKGDFVAEVREFLRVMIKMR
jgi:hypothetical protein